MPDEATVSVPAAAPPPPPSSAAPPASGGVSSPSSADEGGAGAAEPAPKAPEPVAEPEFDWDKWDGSLEAIPEPHREIAGRVHGYFTPRLTEAQEAQAALQRKVDTLQTWYDALDDGQEDSVIAEHRTKLTEAEQRLAAAERAHAAERATWDEYIAKEAESYTKYLRETYKQVFENEEANALLNELLDTEMEPEAACKTAARGRDFAEAVKEQKARGATDEIAVEMAELRLGAKPKVNRAAELVDDGSPGQRNAETQRGLQDMKTRRERNLWIAQKAIAAHKE